ncbi:MAG: hypothetical protein PHE88_00765 [Elusimicrobia bacterium]|nr:hypothetical protein [Elusimicrobiota bacterium]
MIKFNEIVFIVLVLIILSGVYLFVNRVVLSPAEVKKEVFKSQGGGMIIKAQEYREQNEQMDARNERELKKMQKMIDGVKPQIEKSEAAYNKEYGKVFNLPEKQQEKELKKMIDNKQKEYNKYRK